MAKLKLRSAQWIVDEHNNIIIGKGRAEILENIEKLNIIVEVLRYNVDRYVSSELAHATKLQQDITQQNKVLGLLLG